MAICIRVCGCMQYRPLQASVKPDAKNFELVVNGLSCWVGAEFATAVAAAVRAVPKLDVPKRRRARVKVSRACALRVRHLSPVRALFIACLVCLIGRWVAICVCGAMMTISCSHCVARVTP